MGDKVRTLDYYGFDYDSTMVKKDENYKDECFQVSKVKEIKNKKYVIYEPEDTGTTESNIAENNEE